MCHSKDSTKTDFREIITSKATCLDCTEQVSCLSDTEAVWFIQRREGTTPCFGRQPYCEETRCLWHAHCPDSPEQLNQSMLRSDTLDSIAHHDGRLSLPLHIAKRAFEKCCYDDVKDLPDIEAVRVIQQVEGCTPCFARQQALYPSEQDPLVCSNTSCSWKGFCDPYRSIEVQPLEKYFPFLAKNEFIQIRTDLLDCVKDSSFVLPENTVGLKLRSLNSLATSSRKMLLVTPRTTISEAHNDSHINLKRYLLRFQAEPSYSGGRGANIKLNWEILETSDIGELVNWLSAAKPFFKAGKLDYWPLFYKVVNHTYCGLSETELGCESWRKVSSPTSWACETFDAPHVATLDGDISLTDAGLVPLFHIDLPVLENIKFNTLFDLMKDYPEELTSFRDFFQAQIENMRSSAIGSNEFITDCRRIERNIRDGKKKLHSDMKRAKLKAAFSLTGCAIATWTLAIYCILHGDSGLLRIIGPGGIVYTASSAYSEYLLKRMELKEHPVYFLWELGRSKNH